MKKNTKKVRRKKNKKKFVDVRGFFSTNNIRRCHQAQTFSFLFCKVNFFFTLFYQKNYFLK